MSERTPVIDPPRTLVEGLRLDQPTFGHALLDGDRKRLRAVLDVGCDTAEHADFEAGLKARCT